MGEMQSVFMFRYLRVDVLGREYGDGWLHEYTQEKAIVYPIGI
jgi:hypothetical protein